jgi:hypothetical protein
MRAIPVIIANRSPGGDSRRAGAGSLGSGVGNDVLQHADGGKQVVV